MSDNHQSAQPVSYEYRQFSVPRSVSRADLRRMLTEDAEYRRWELHRVRVYFGGSRRIWLRRRIIRVRATGPDSGPKLRT